MWLLIYIISVLIVLPTLLWMDTTYESGKTRKSSEEAYLGAIFFSTLLSIIPVVNVLVCYAFLVKFYLVYRIAKKKSS